MTAMKEYFDAKAPFWDMGRQDNIDAIKRVTQLAGIKEGSYVLDVGCGTGAMFNAYIEAGANNIYALDASSEMIKMAQKKFKDCHKIAYFCDDIASWRCNMRFDAIVFYNCWPHILEPEKVARHCSTLSKRGGRFLIAHGKGKDLINNHHKGVPEDITRELMAPENEERYWVDYYDIDIRIDEPDFYCMSGILKA